VSKFLKRALAGAAVGAVAAAADAYRHDRPVNQLARNVARCSAGGAVLGSLTFLARAA
jgi:hypothetical protein